MEDNSQPSSTKKQTISEPFSVDVYYDKKNNRYIDAWQTGSHTDEDGYAEFDLKQENIIITTRPAKSHRRKTHS